MNAARALVVAVIVPVMMLSILVVGALAAGPLPKETVCHFANHKYVEISVSGHAVAAHLRHGDVLLDEYGACP